MKKYFLLFAMLLASFLLTGLLTGCDSNSERKGETQQVQKLKKVEEGQ